MPQVNVLAIVATLLAISATGANGAEPEQQILYPANMQDVSYEISTADCGCEIEPSVACGDAACECGDAISTGCGDAACGCDCPDCAAKKPKPNPCATSHKGLFYANDFSYLKDPNYCGCCLGDELKLMKMGPCSTLDIGGQYRFRYHHERGMGQNAGFTRFQATENDFGLSRLRLYANWKYGDNIRVFAEGIYADAHEFDADYIPRGIDENYGDLLNLFVDLKLTDSATVRVGRQELLYGDQRVVSPLDWANTRRTFEGVKLIYTAGDWAIDGFYTKFVPVVSTEFDRTDDDRSFYGMYAVYNGCENRTYDFYYLGFDDNRLAPGGAASDFSLHTLGSRVNGNKESWLYELEGAYQFGSQGALGQDHSAAFVTGGLGRKLSDCGWKPTLWFYYDYASGDSPGGDFTRFNQLFPLAHKYLGFIDATQRANVHSPNVLLTASPHKDWKLLLWYYHFMAVEGSDIVPSIGGTPAQNNSTDWGDEIDFIATYNISPRSDILFGYSHFWAGSKIAPPGGAEDADFFYTQFTVNF